MNSSGFQSLDSLLIVAMSAMDLTGDRERSLDISIEASKSKSTKQILPDDSLRRLRARFALTRVFPTPPLVLKKTINFAFDIIFRIILAVDDGDIYEEIVIIEKAGKSRERSKLFDGVY